MAPPIHTIPYIPQVSTFNDPVNFDISVNWTGADFFEVNTLPPGFTFDGDVNLGGIANTQMSYFIFIRAGNDDGLSDWQPLLWTIAAGAGATKRTLYGLSLDYQLLNPLGTAAVIFIKTATKTGRQSTWNAGVMFINDIEDDGNAAKYDASFVNSQIILDGGSDTQIRATEPGWEIIIDTASA